MHNGELNSLKVESSQRADPNHLLYGLVEAYMVSWASQGSLLRLQRGDARLVPITGLIRTTPQAPHHAFPPPRKIIQYPSRLLQHLEPPGGLVQRLDRLLRDGFQPATTTPEMKRCSGPAHGVHSFGSDR